jgi:hypothetical protein
MARTARQKRIAGRVMHEFKHGELNSGRGGRAGPVKSRRQAIAIALEEAGASIYESDRRNRRNLRRAEQKEAEGKTAQQEREGRSRLGARGKRESTRSMGGEDARADGTRSKSRDLTRTTQRWPNAQGPLCASATSEHPRALEDDQAPT